MPYSHLYDVDECSKFVADFIYYSPDRSASPLYCTVLYCTVLYCRVYSGAVTSPSSVIVQQAGNSLEMSILLVSLLRSAQGNKNIFAIT